MDQAMAVAVTALAISLWNTLVLIEHRIATKKDLRDLVAAVELALKLANVNPSSREATLLEELKARLDLAAEQASQPGSGQGGQ